MKTKFTTLLILAGLLLAGCISSSCPPDSVTYLNPPYPTEVTNESPQSQIIEIKGDQVMVDQVIRGDVCNDTWRGVVYVTCDIQVPAWEKDPFFFQDCDLEIDEGAVVYVEAHKDESYDDGCSSCHE